MAADVSGQRGSADGPGLSRESEPEEQPEEPPDAESGVTDESADALSLDVVFEILKNERRRLVLHYLQDEDDPVSIGELAEHIAALENDKSVSALSSKERKRVYVGLYQCHLPKMDDAGVVNFERNPGISLGAHADQVVEYLDAADAEPDRQYRAYAGLAAAGLGLLALGPVTGAPLLVSVAVGVVLAGTLALAVTEMRSADD